MPTDQPEQQNASGVTHQDVMACVDAFGWWYADHNDARPSVVCGKLKEMLSAIFVTPATPTPAAAEEGVEFGSVYLQEGRENPPLVQTLPTPDAALAQRCEYAEAAQSGELYRLRKANSDLTIENGRLESQAELWRGKYCSLSETDHLAAKLYAAESETSRLGMAYKAATERVAELERWWDALKQFALDGYFASQAHNDFAHGYCKAMLDIQSQMGLLPPPSPPPASESYDQATNPSSGEAAGR